MIWENLTTREVEGLDRGTVVVLPIAAIEQHGLHLALSTDATIGMHFLREADARCGDDMLVLPQIKVCCSEHHMDFAGTLSVSPETFLVYASEVLESVIRHGFRNLVVFNSHGGNQAIGQVLVDKVGAKHRHCRVAFLTWWHLAGPEIAPLQESGFGGVNHACEFETSVMLHAAPEDVRRDLIGGMSRVTTFNWAESDMLHGSRGVLYRTMAQKSGGIGTVGDPSRSSPAQGQKITHAVIDALQTVVASLRSDDAHSHG